MLFTIDEEIPSSYTDNIQSNIYTYVKSRFNKFFYRNIGKILSKIRDFGGRSLFMTSLGLSLRTIHGRFKMKTYRSVMNGFVSIELSR